MTGFLRRLAGAASPCSRALMSVSRALEVTRSPSTLSFVNPLFLSSFRQRLSAFRASIPRTPIPTSTCTQPCINTETCAHTTWRQHGSAGRREMPADTPRCKRSSAAVQRCVLGGRCRDCRRRQDTDQHATHLQHTCNRTRTSMPRRSSASASSCGNMSASCFLISPCPMTCNTNATHVQHKCNTRATHMQHTCNTHATHVGFVLLHQPLLLDPFSVLNPEP